MDKFNTSATAGGAVPRQHRATGLTVAVLGLGGIGAVAAGYLHATGRHRIIACTRQPLERIVIERSHLGYRNQGRRPIDTVNSFVSQEA